MRFLAKIFAAIFLSIIISAVTTGHTQTQIQPLSSESFSPIIVPSTIPIIREHFRIVAPTSRLRVTQPLAAVRTIEKTQILPRTIVQPSSGVSGNATWYCLQGVSVCHRDYSGGLYAAAGPQLRVGNWRGRHVQVWYSGRSVSVALVDWCACPNRLIDLYSDAFRQLAPLSAGQIKVKITWQ